jgi:hypothetical protein
LLEWLFLFFFNELWMTFVASLHFDGWLLYDYCNQSSFWWGCKPSHGCILSYEGVRSWWTTTTQPR